MAHTHPLLEAILPRRTPRFADQVGHQLAHLSRDFRRLAGQARSYSQPRIEEATHAATDFAEDVIYQVTPVARDVAHEVAHGARVAAHGARVAARQAKVAGQMVRDDPVPTIVAFGTFALICSLLLSRR